MLSPELKKQLGGICALILVMGLIQLAVCLALSLTAGISFPRAAAGTAAGCALAAVNLLLLAVSVEKAVSKGPKNAQARMSLSYTGRLLLTAAVLIAVIKLPGVFNLWTAVIPLVFPRAAILLLNLKNKGKGGEKI